MYGLNNAQFTIDLFSLKPSKVRLIDEKGLLTDELKDSILKCTKENAHGSQIRMIRKNQDGLIITCSDDATIKIWG